MAEDITGHGITDQTQVADDNKSDYGSEFSPEEESILGDLLCRAHQETDNPNQDSMLQLKDLDENDRTHEIKIPLYPFGEAIQQSAHIQPAEFPFKSSAAQSKSAPRVITRADGQVPVKDGEPLASIEAPLDPPIDVADFRSPLERFRTKPRKSLSVTDLISPSWCEIQFWYTLTKGKRKPTAAMQKGTAIHKTLEEQVYTTVSVETTTWQKEDSWGLRIWNIIQGLRTLRETGMTREFEVWGVVDGLLVNGMIDELSTQCRDKGLEVLNANPSQQLLSLEGQSTITGYLGWKRLEPGGLRSVGTSKTPLNTRIYITDVKTRGAPSLPRGAAFRPTKLQLMLYYRLLSDMATGNVDLKLILDRFDLDGHARFSDSFVSQIGSLNEACDSASQRLSQNYPGADASSQDSLSILLAHNSLQDLWTFMLLEFSETFPRGIDSVGKILAAEYRDSSQGEIVGQKTFLYDENHLNEYIAQEMPWWRGERAPEGVRIEEAFKCGTCQFAEVCTWRANKIEDAVLKMRERNRSQV